MQKLNLHKIFWYFFPNFSSLIQLFFVRKVNETTDRNNNIIMEDIEAYFVTAVNVAKDAGKVNKHCCLVLVLVLVDTQQSSQRSITLRSISRQQISPKIL